MLQVVLCIGGALVAFLGMTFWANGEKFKSDNVVEDEIV